MLLFSHGHISVYKVYIAGPSWGFEYSVGRKYRFDVRKLPGFHKSRDRGHHIEVIKAAIDARILMASGYVPPEVRLVRDASVEELPLLLSSLETEEGKKALVAKLRGFQK